MSWKVFDHWVNFLAPHGTTQKSNQMSESVAQMLLGLQMAQCCDCYPGDPVPVPEHPHRAEPFPNIQSELPWCSLMLSCTIPNCVLNCCILNGSCSDATCRKATDSGGKKKKKPLKISNVLICNSHNLWRSWIFDNLLAKIFGKIISAITILRAFHKKRGN